MALCVAEPEGVDATTRGATGVMTPSASTLSDVTAPCDGATLTARSTGGTVALVLELTVREADRACVRAPVLTLEIATACSTPTTRGVDGAVEACDAMLEE